MEVFEVQGALLFAAAVVLSGRHAQPLAAIELAKVGPQNACADIDLALARARDRVGGRT